MHRLLLVVLVVGAHSGTPMPHLLFGSTAENARCGKRLPSPRRPAAGGLRASTPSRADGDRHGRAMRSCLAGAGSTHGIVVRRRQA